MRLSALFITLLLCLPLKAQQAAGFQGIVTDSSKAVVPGATVSVKNLDTGQTRTVKTNEVGFYTVPLLNPGRYRLECSAPGFAARTTPELQLEVGQVGRVDFELQLGAVAEAIEVSAAAALLQTEKTDVGQVIDGKRILEMPLNRRNYLELAQLTAGILPASQLGKGAKFEPGEGGFTAVGTNSHQQNILLDGNDNSSRTHGGGLGRQTQVVKPPVDAVAEFKVITNNTSAEYGYRVGAKVLVSTKSGTNSLHGSLYEFLRNSALDGTNFFANRSGSPKPPYRHNQFGGTLGGPIVKNRTFYFASYQGTRVRLGQSYVSSVPSREAREGLFANQPQTRRNIFDPLTLRGAGTDATRLPFPGNQVPAARFDPVSKRLMDLYPDPNVPGREHLPNNFFLSPTDTDDDDQFDFRIDHNITDAHRAFVRYSVRNRNAINPGPLPMPADGGGQTFRIDGDNLACNYNASIGPTMFNELRFGYSRFPTLFDTVFKENMNQQFGIINAPSNTASGYSSFRPSGFATVGTNRTWPNQNNLENYLVADSFMIQKGLHGIKFGGEFRRQRQFRHVVRNSRGYFAFSGVYTSEKPNVAASRANTGNPLADMLLGWASGGMIGTPMGEDVIAPYYGFFIQDDWKLSPRLTLNVGLRWELFQTPFFPNPERQGVSRLLTVFNGVPLDQERLVFPKDGHDCGCIEDFNNFAPRLGLAYRVNNATVVRIGAGIYYGEADELDWQAARFKAGPPKQLDQSLEQGREITNLIVRNGFPTVVSGVVPPGLNLENVYPYFQANLYVSQWFFDVQRTLPGEALLTLGYNGSASTHLTVNRNINAPFTPHPTIRWQDRKIRPYYNSVQMQQNMASASYQSLSIKAEKRFSHGFTFLSSFTWAHSIDFAGPVQTNEASGMATPWDLRRERGNSDFDRRLAYSVSGLYEVPFGKGRKWFQAGPASWILGGWQIGGLLSLFTGMPYDHSFNIDNQNTGGRVRGDWVRNPNLPASQRTVDRWFDTDFVIASAPGVISNAGRNIIYGPGRRNFDLVISRDIPMPREGHRLQFRFESFNFSNTPYFGSLNTAVGAPGAGIINAADEPRRIQFGLKYAF